MLDVARLRKNATSTDELIRTRRALHALLQDHWIVYRNLKCGRHWENPPPGLLPAIYGDFENLPSVKEAFACLPKEARDGGA